MKYLVLLIILVSLLYFCFSTRNKEKFGIFQIPYNINLKLKKTIQFIIKDIINSKLLNKFINENLSFLFDSTTLIEDCYNKLSEFISKQYGINVNENINFILKYILDKDSGIYNEIKPDIKTKLGGGDKIKILWDIMIDPKYNLDFNLMIFFVKLPEILIQTNEPFIGNIEQCGSNGSTIESKWPINTSVFFNSDDNNKIDIDITNMYEIKDKPQTCNNELFKDTTQTIKNCYCFKTNNSFNAIKTLLNFYLKVINSNTIIKFIEDELNNITTVEDLENKIKVLKDRNNELVIFSMFIRCILYVVDYKDKSKLIYLYDKKDFIGFINVFENENYKLITNTEFNLFSLILFLTDIHIIFKLNNDTIIAPTMASTMDPTMAPQNSYTTEIIIDDKTLKLNNIKSINNKIKYNNSETQTQCSSKYDCADFKYGECISSKGGDGGECWNIFDKSIYKFDGTKSFIELVDVNNLDINLRFVLMLVKVPKDETIIVYSGIDVWSINIENSQDGSKQFIIKLPNNKELVFANIDVSVSTLYKFDLQVTPKKIKCTITTDSDEDGEYQSADFITDTYNIYNCKMVSKDNIYKTCKPLNTIGDYNKYNFKNAPIYFGGINSDVISLDANTYYFLDGYLGGFEFSTKFAEEKCGYKISDDINLIKKQCLDDCIKTDDCNKRICEERCKNVKECYFNSKTSQSRHAIDCVNKCIDPENKCSTQYCQNQCYNCGDECYWIKEKSYLEDDSYLKSGRPYPPYISPPYISYDGTKASFKWKPSKKGSGGETLGYVALLYKTYDPNKSLKIEWINVNRCNRYCKYIINNLDPEEAYTIGIKAYNVSGTGMTSNLINFKTNKTVINTDILNNIKSPTNTEIGNFKSCPK